MTLPLTIITLGLFYFVVNGLAFNLAASLVPGFHVANLWSGILAAIVVSIVSWLIGLITGTGEPTRCARASRKCAPSRAATSAAGPCR